MPTVSKIPGPEYELKQSNSEVMSRCPCRKLLVMLSNSGKTTIIANLVLNKDMYRRVFERIYIFSPTIHLDDTWTPVKKYIYEVIGHDEEKEGPRLLRAL